MEPGPIDTAILFRRSEEGREFRRRAAAGALPPRGISRVPECFHDLLKHLASPISKATGLPVHCTDYESMIDGDGAPHQFDFAAVRRKLGSIAKQKAPGLSGNGPDLYACMSDCRVDWAVALCNIIQHSQVTPRAWHVDLVHYVHKGGSDISLSNHRPQALVEVFRKVFTSVIIGRMRRDWNRLQVLGSCCNPGFQAGRTTANAAYPARTAAEHCMQSKTELVALLDGLRWCFDTPANTVIELALFRLGVPDFYCNFLNDIDLHSVKSTVTTAGITLGILLAMGAEGTHRQEHGTGQGTTEGPLNWVPVEDMVISVARAVSTQPVQVPTGNGKFIPWHLRKHGGKQLKQLSQVIATCADVRLGWRRAFRGRCCRGRRSSMGLARCDSQPRWRKHVDISFNHLLAARITRKPALPWGCCGWHNGEEGSVTQSTRWTRNTYDCCNPLTLPPPQAAHLISELRQMGYKLAWAG